jgi:hypothetical protein
MIDDPEKRRVICKEFSDKTGEVAEYTSQLQLTENGTP